MKIKMVDLSAGPGGIMQPGQQYEVTENVAKALIAGHHAVPVANEEQPGDEVTENVANDAGKGKTVPGRNNK